MRRFDSRSRIREKNRGNEQRYDPFRECRPESTKTAHLISIDYSRTFRNREPNFAKVLGGWKSDPLGFSVESDVDDREHDRYAERRRGEHE